MMNAHKYRVVSDTAEAAAGSGWLQRVAWLRVSSLGLSVGIWGLVFIVVRGFSH
jgi:hypothetical protein